MSTTTDEAELPENVYDVRGRRLQIDYDSDDHSVTIHSPGIGDELEGSTNPQATLEDLGIYTRVQSLDTVSGNYITISLKPAASVELRDSPEEGTTLMARPISKKFDGSTISKRRGKYGYTATCSMEQMEDVGLEHKDSAAMYAELRDGVLCLRVEPGEAPHAMTARIDSTGLVGVPNGLAAAANLDGHGVDWEVTDNGDALIGHTTYEPDSMEMPDIDADSDDPVDHHYRAAVSFVEQEWEGRTQTHFTVYVKSDFIRALDWGSEDGLFKQDDQPTREEVLADYVDIQLVSIDGELGVCLTDDIRPQYVDEVTIEETDSSDEQWDATVRTAPCVRKLYQNKTNGQTTFTFPHSLAHALAFTDEWRRVREMRDNPDNPRPRLTSDISRGKQVDWALSNGDALGKPLDPADVDGIVAEEDVDEWLEAHDLDRDSGILDD